MLWFMHVLALLHIYSKVFNDMASNDLLRNKGSSQKCLPFSGKLNKCSWIKLIIMDLLLIHNSSKPNK